MNIYILFIFLEARKFSTTTTATMTRKMIAESARSAGTLECVGFLIALYT